MKKFILSLIVVTLLGVGFFWINKINKQISISGEDDNNIVTNNIINKTLGFQVVLAADDNKIIFKWSGTGKDVSYYKLYHGVVSGVYGESINTNGKVSTLAVDTSKFNSFNHFFVLSAVDDYGNESDYSRELEINLDPDFIGATTIASCGNGILQLEEGEICDGGYEQYPSTASLGIYNGVKECKVDCSGWENNADIIEYCGDGLINGPEKCDPATNVSSFIYCETGGELGKKFCDETSCLFGSCQAVPEASL